MTIDVDAMVRDAAALVSVPSVTGDERAALERLGELAAALGLECDLHRHDLAALRTHPDHPGEEAPRDELWGLTVTLPGTRPGRIALNGHVDVVSPGTEPWRLGPWSGAVEGGRLHGRGAVDMKGPVVAALHALAALKDQERPEVVLMAVPSEEDGGLGTFAELERDATFDAALLPEPTGLRVVCAQAGALTFKGEIRGVAAHAAERLSGHSAIDRYVKVHAAFAAHERAVNTDVAHPLMRELPLPYPLLVGQLHAGEWSSMVPDRLVFEGRLGVPVGADLQQARDELQAVLDRALDDGLPPCRLTWEGGAFAPGTTDPDHPWVKTVQEALAAETGSAPLAGVPWGADMRLFTARGIPAVMVGTRDIELAHAVDESVAIDELATVARTIVRAVNRAPV
ncbi:M20/M25/M40 family metallo-hydrolase [Solirubrobacter sp. CPCC 204708]|uniref:M20/M25/M40 family metallo-hydrolase n=1 Tax=Solirubrobacter deserti TaxID=2282478 RepID=A0ABT4RJR2_9ACTN|nr:M20/M25/M40 family metallo-hydrolase [Solirubrobacter deserti]MBE2320870.1 M20/M25/M40 family metallo-hydrolase [Solirubrobacter deserti]MDA0138505.1 M20/M25/M40 family metallo-hydrolase [Solirubrobacter deserti]